MAESGDNPDRLKFDHHDHHPLTVPSGSIPSCARMSPVAVQPIQDLPTTSHQQKQSAVGAPGPALAIGSPSTAQDGTYPSLISELERDSANVSEVERQMLDRILDGGVFLSRQETGGTDSNPNISLTQLPP